MTDPSITPHDAEPAAAPSPRRPTLRQRRTLITGLAALALLAVGAGAGAGVTTLLHRDRVAFDAALRTTPIAQLKASDRVEVQGRVAEIFGNKFVVADDGGRALVETGRAGENNKLVTANDTVTVQGRFADGFLQATALQYADGRVEELRPAPPPHPRRGDHGLGRFLGQP